MFINKPLWTLTELINWLTALFESARSVYKQTPVWMAQVLWSLNLVHSLSWLDKILNMIHIHLSVSVCHISSLLYHVYLSITSVSVSIHHLSITWVSVSITPVSCICQSLQFISITPCLSVNRISLSVYHTSVFSNISLLFIYSISLLFDLAKILTYSSISNVSVIDF